MSLLPTIQRSKTRGELRRRLLVKAVKSYTQGDIHTRTTQPNAPPSKFRKAQAKGFRNNGINKNEIRRRHKKLIQQANSILNPPP